MRRRFTLAIVSVVAGALLIAGVGTLLLLTVEARHSARHDAVDLADRIAAQYSAPSSPTDPLPALRTLQDLLRTTQQLSLIRLQPPRAPATMPGGLTLADVDVPALRQGETVSGFKGRTAFAAVPFVDRQASLAIVVTQRAAGARGAGLYFLVAGLSLVVIAFAVAKSLARRITEPLVRVKEAAGRIARGDLGARVPAAPGRSYPEIHELSASIDTMADNLERLRGQERQFLMSVSHDLRTPLTSIRGYAEALADGTTTDTGKAAGIIGAEAARLERLVRDLLDLAKLDAHSFSLRVQPTDVAQVVAETALGFRPTAEALGLRIVVHDPVAEPGGLWAAGIDPDRLSQVVANLVENACKHATGTVEVGTWTRDGAVLLTVDDDGPGIAPDELPHVFERLWTSSRGRSGRQVGSGLGLAIAWELVTAMGGTIRAESPVPRWEAGDNPGTRMVVSLRAVAGDALGREPA